MPKFVPERSTLELSGAGEEEMAQEGLCFPHLGKHWTFIQSHLEGDLHVGS